MRTSRSVRLAIALMIAAACAPPVPTPRDGDEDDTTLPDRNRSTEPDPRESTTSETKKTTESPNDAQVDAGSGDGEAGAKLPNGSACTTNEQCAGGVCVELDDDDEARVCTQACEEDDDCPDGNDCNDGVCEIDD